MKTFVLGALVGYVFGTRAGRARYEQIVRTYRRLADHPAVQGAAGVVRAKVEDKMGDRMPFVHGTDGHRASEATTHQ